MTALTAALADVLWSFGFMLRHGAIVVALSAIPAAQRTVAALHPEDGRAHAWPVDLLVAGVRVVTVVLVFWIGWREDASARDVGPGRSGQVIDVLVRYLRHDWARAVAGALMTIVVLVVLGVLVALVVDGLAHWWDLDPRAAAAWTFGLRNLLIIPVVYVTAYGLARPAFLTAWAHPV